MSTPKMPSCNRCFKWPKTPISKVPWLDQANSTHQTRLWALLRTISKLAPIRSTSSMPTKRSQIIIWPRMVTKFSRLSVNSTIWKTPRTWQICWQTIKTGLIIFCRIRPSKVMCCQLDKLSSSKRPKCWRRSIILIVKICPVTAKTSLKRQTLQLHHLTHFPRGHSPIFLWATETRSIRIP